MTWYLVKHRDILALLWVLEFHADKRTMYEDLCGRFCQSSWRACVRACARVLGSRTEISRNQSSSGDSVVGVLCGC